VRELTPEEVGLAAAMAEAGPEDNTEAPPGGLCGGGTGRGGSAAEEANGGEGRGGVGSLLDVARFDLGGVAGGVDAVDEWDDDLDPGYTVLAVSEQELHGQVG